MNKNLNFECTKCGSCCKTPPQLTAEEALNFSDKFFLQLSHYSIISYEKNPLERELLEHYNKFCHIFFLPEKQCHLYYFVSLSAVSRPSEFCPQLTADNLCSIQNDKPLFCRAAPLNITMPETKQLSAFNNQWLPLIESGVFKCNISGTAPVYIKDNTIAQRDDEDYYYGLLNQIRKLTAFYINNVLKDDQERQKHLGYCFDSCEKTNSSLFYTSSLDLFDFYYKLSLLRDFELKQFIEKQSNFLKKDIAQALIKKDLNDRSITNLMKKELNKLEMYRFEEENEDFNII